MALALALAKPSQLPLHRHVSASPFFPPSPSNLSPLRCRASSPPSSCECRAAQSRRRSVSISTALLLVLFPRWTKIPKKRSFIIEFNLSDDLLNWVCLDAGALAGGGGVLDKYVKKKKLDPLDAYVLAVIPTQLQIEDLGKTLEGNDPEFAFCRSLLRSVPAASLHVNIRVVAQYASESGDGSTAFNDVD